MKTSLIIRPVITEKSMYNASDNVYTFEVDKSATKHEIQAMIEKTFSVTVKKINTTIKKPAQKRTGRRRIAVNSSPKKLARVWLAEKDKVDLFDFEEK